MKLEIESSQPSGATTLKTDRKVRKSVLTKNQCKEEKLLNNRCDNLTFEYKVALLLWEGLKKTCVNNENMAKDRFNGVDLAKHEKPDFSRLGLL